MLEETLHTNFIQYHVDDPVKLVASDYEPRICAKDLEYEILKISKIVTSYEAAIMKKTNEIKKCTQNFELYSVVEPKSETMQVDTEQNCTTASLPVFQNASDRLGGLAETVVKSEDGVAPSSAVTIKQEDEKSKDSLEEKMLEIDTTGMGASPLVNSTEKPMLPSNSSQSDSVISLKSLIKKRSHSKDTKDKDRPAKSVRIAEEAHWFGHGNKPHSTKPSVLISRSGKDSRGSKRHKNVSNKNPALRQ